VTLSTSNLSLTHKLICPSRRNYPLVADLKIIFIEFNVHGSMYRNNILVYNKTQRYTVYFIWKLLYIFRALPPPIIRSANNCIYRIWCLSHRYATCSYRGRVGTWNWFEFAVGGVRHSQHTHTHTQTFICWTLSGSVRYLTTSNNYTSDNLPTYAKPEAACAVLGS